ncbi:hypothetical protein [Streptomyces chilikensis]|uniref:hypothetical protein n=1 Tax=Streptomyces chilikensis TaxID=1194079 RepID=UPI000ADF508F|nr:hypothetical protein [Streptomyces chilikensis]
MKLLRIATGRTTRAAALAAGLLLVSTGCSSGGGDDPDKGSSAGTPGKRTEDKTPPKGEQEAAVLAEVKSGDISLAVTSAVRDEGGFVTLNGTVTNNGGEFWVAGDWRGDESELNGNGPSMAGASLVDSKAKKKYLVLRDTEGRCLCTKFDGGGVDTGKTADWYAQFPAPSEDATEVKFQIGSMPPATVQLSAGE